MSERTYLTYDDFPKHIANILERAKAWWKLDEDKNTLHIISRNKEAPLTNEEKIKICKYLVTNNHIYRAVKFDDSTPIVDKIVDKED